MTSAPLPSPIDATVEQLMSTIESLYAYAHGSPIGPGSDDALAALPQGSPLAEVAIRVDSGVSLAMAEALGEVLYECRGALEYAEVDAPAHRLARRVVEALAAIVPPIGDQPTG